MNDFSRILVPVDGSEISERAAQKAINLAQLSEGTIDFLYVANITGITGGDHLKSDLNLPAEVLENLKTSGKKVLERVVKNVPRGMKVNIHCKTGLPAETILATASELNSSLIIMGSRGLNLAESMLLGSVSQFLLTRGHFPVLVVK
ncbi:universal stress protein [Anaerosinus sp.]|uniref:universal stress protein n=1 Tax=Selenobaculum sp. TaxID=3074374 RepID=UPI0015B19E6F